jgi:hypothetical protein
LPASLLTNQSSKLANKSANPNKLIDKLAHQ